MVQKEAGSFRDPSGQVIYKGGAYYREIRPYYFNDYNYLIKSGLYKTLVGEGLLLEHTEVETRDDWIMVRPRQIPFVSYPYEWSFEYLKEAAINTLEICRVALDYNMILKDASAFNIQRYKGKMMLIDTLSFVRYENGQPWIAHRQFLQHFLAPLLLAKYRNLNTLSSLYIDGVPLGIAYDLLPFRVKFSPAILLNIGLQSIQAGAKTPREIKMPKTNLYALLNNLKNYITKLEYKKKSLWQDYSEAGSYTEAAKKDKKEWVKHILGNEMLGSTICDIGANNGEYAKLASEYGYNVIALDRDYAVLSELSKDKKLVCIVQDICSPAPAIGWANKERRSFTERLKADTILALALIHHICIGNNTPLSMVAELFSKLCKYLIIEFVPPDDPKAKLLVGNKIYPEYNLGLFEQEFGRYFSIKASKGVAGSCRRLYFMQLKAR